MNIETTAQTEKTSSAATVPAPKATLAQFIEANSKLVTSIAAFVALTAFSSQIDNADIKLHFSALSFSAAGLLTLELLAKFPPPPRHWRLEAFSFVLTILVAAMGYYWFVKFPAVWVPQVATVLYVVVAFVVLLVPASGLTHISTKGINFIIARIWKREPQQPFIRRIRMVVFLTWTALVFAGLVWVSKKLAAHPIRVHIPWF
jgi:hypothetical protein